MEIYIFGDQTADCRSFLTKVFYHRGNLLLDSFLAQAAQVIRQEVVLRDHGFGSIPDFGTIQELSDRYYRQDIADPAVESTLVCVSQLAHFIGYFEEQPRKYPDFSKDVRLVGLCTGLLSAVAVAASRSLVELIPRAVEIVRIAFRTGSCVAAVADRFGGNIGKDSWSTIVVAEYASAQRALDRFHTEKVRLCKVPVADVVVTHELGHPGLEQVMDQCNLKHISYYQWAIFYQRSFLRDTRLPAKNDQSKSYGIR